MIFEEALVLNRPFDEVVADVKKAFSTQGFGALTEIDMKATLKAKLDRDIDRYSILGMCNPNFASQALDACPQIGVLLPCNVVVRETDDGVTVEVMDPGLMASITGDPAIEPLAAEVRELINNALAQLN